MPSVSIVVATYNQAGFLAEAIASVRAQTFADWELLVVDDGSTDDTAAVAARFRDDDRIHYLPGAHAERAAARNRGVAAATGDLVAFLDADDLWRPEKLARQVAALAAAPGAGACYTASRFVDRDGRPLPIRKPMRAADGYLFPALARGNFVILASMVVRRVCLEALGGFDTTLPVYGCEDWDLWLRLARRWPIAALDEELTLYRRHASNTRWQDVLASGLAVIDRLWADPAVAEQAALSHAAARARHLWYHAAAVAAAERSAALPLVGRALREDPRTLLSRPAAGALAAIGLPRAFERALRALPI